PFPRAWPPPVIGPVSVVAVPASQNGAGIFCWSGAKLTQNPLRDIAPDSRAQKRDRQSHLPPAPSAFPEPWAFLPLNLPLECSAHAPAIRASLLQASQTAHRSQANQSQHAPLWS